MLTRAAALRTVAAALTPGATGGIGVPAGGWEAVLDVAAAHGLLPALWTVAAPEASAATGADRAPFAIIEDAHRVNQARVADLEDQGRAVLDGFAGAGIEGIPLKGWHGLLVGRWPDPAARVMVDLDVLVPPDAVDRAAAVLADLGYVDLGVEDPEGLAGHEVPARGRPGRAGSVEVQREALVPRRSALLPAAAVRAAAVPVGEGPRTVRVPSPTHAVVLLIAHAQVQDDGARLLRVPLRALVEAAVLLAGPEGPQVDWDEVVQRFRRAGAAVPLAGFAVALDDLTGVSIPVPRRGGGAWWRAAESLLDRPRTAGTWREVASLPRTLASERMARRYGARGWGDRQRARIGLVARGMGKRVRRG